MNYSSLSLYRRLSFFFSLSSNESLIVIVEQTFWLHFLFENKKKEGERRVSMFSLFWESRVLSGMD